jgi:hypothetical protein
MNDGKRKMWKEAVVIYLEIQTQHLPEETEKNHKIPYYDLLRNLHWNLEAKYDARSIALM